MIRIESERLKSNGKCVCGDDDDDVSVPDSNIGFAAILSRSPFEGKMWATEWH